MINLKHKYILTHPQKCGGTSIEEILFKDDSISTIGDKPLKHKSLSTHISIIESLNHDLNHFFKFSLTRNPWEVVVSHFFYDKLLEIPKRKLLPHPLSPRYQEIDKLDFKGYVRKKFFFGGDMEHFMFHKNKFNLDYVIHYDRLQEGFEEVCGKIGITPQVLPHENKLNHLYQHYAEYYDNETRSIVAEIYKRDIDYFGYEFNE